MYTEPLVKDEHQRDDNDGKWLKELSLQISAGFSAQKAWISMVPIVKSGNLIYAHHSNESMSKLQLRNNANKTPPRKPGKGRSREAPGPRFPMDVRLHTTSRKEDLIFSMATLGYMTSKR